VVIVPTAEKRGRMISYTKASKILPRGEARADARGKEWEK
jgi:hypothetical protein